jgi:hypothetical protein
MLFCVASWLSCEAVTARTAGQLLPVDQAAERPDFFSFRAHLQAAVARHDAEAVMAVVHPNIRNSFGDDDGSEAFRRGWRVNDANSGLWAELGAVLALGGTFQGEGRQTFVAPYTFSRWPGQYDSFEHIVLVAADVRIREAARADGAVVARMSFAILPLARVGDPGETRSWRAVQLEGNRIGYVAAPLARSPIDYRAIFTLDDGRWQLVTFVAGD